MIFLIDKPSGITSQGVVSKVKYALKQFDKNIKVGHTGTLDPMCTGLLPVLTGKDTKLIPYLPSDKAYRAGLLLGRTTDTEDVTGKTLSESCASFDFETVKAAAESFVGEIMQVPPMYSAIKMNGNKLYDLARQGIEVERKARKINIYSLKIAPSDKKNTYDLEVYCSSGTYIRTLCADIGKTLGCGGCMASLRRTVSNGFSVDNAVPLEDAVKIISGGRYDEISYSCEDVFNSKEVILPRDGEKYYINGGAIEQRRLSPIRLIEGIVKVYTSDGAFVGIGALENGCLRPLVSYLN